MSKTNKPIRRFVGIVVSKRSLNVCLMLSETGEIFVLTNDLQGIDELLSRFEENRFELVVLEATGRYEQPAAAAIAAAGIPVAVVKARQTSDFAKATDRLVKTDKIDTEALTRFAAAIVPPPSELPDAEAYALQAILARRRILVEMLTAEMLTAEMLTADNSRLLMAPQAVAKRIHAYINWLQKELQRPDKELDEAIEASDTFKKNEALVRSVPGVGPVLARTLLAELPELGTLSYKFLCALAGVAPFTNDSGQRRGKREV